MPVTIGGSPISPAQAAELRAALGVPTPVVITDSKTVLVGADQTVILDSQNGFQPAMSTLAAVATYVGAPPAETAPAAFTAGQWTATAGDTQVSLNITALPSDGGSAITALQYRLDGGAAVALSGTGTGVRTITGLTNSTSYDIQVRAVNAIGAGAWSDTKARTPVAAGGSSVVVRGGVATESGSFITTMPVGVPAEMVAGDRIVLVASADHAISSFSTGTWEDITPAAWSGSNQQVWASAAFGSVPGSITATFAGSQFHYGRSFAIAGLVADADPVVQAGAGTTGFSGDARSHAYTTTLANSVEVGIIDFTGGGVTGGASADSDHVWLGLSGSGYNIAFAGVRATSGSYGATVAPAGAGSASSYWVAELGGA